MMFKKRKMVDLAELHKKGLMTNNPRVELPSTNRQGYIDLSQKSTTEIREETTPITENSTSVFGFMDNFSPSSPANSFSSETDGYSRREVDKRLEQLDNKIYKMEQRIELLERKANVNAY